MRLTKYKDILGEPGKGFHKPRLFGLARNDLVGTIIIAFLVSHSSSKQFLATFLLFMLIGTYMHWIFGVDTALLRWLNHTLKRVLSVCG